MLIYMCVCLKAQLIVSKIGKKIILENHFSYIVFRCCEPRWRNGYRSCLPHGNPGLIPRWVETLGCVLVNYSLTGPRCKSGTTKCGEDRIMCTSPAWNVWRRHCFHSPQGDGLHLLGSSVKKFKLPLTHKYA